MAFQTGVTDRLATEKPFNNLLRTLRDQDYALIAPHLIAAQQAANELLYNPGDNVDMVYFPCGSSLVSFLVSNEDGRDVETILVGREGAVGGIVSHGRLPAYCRIVVKYGGPFVRLPVSVLEAAKGQVIDVAVPVRALRRLPAGADVPVCGLQRHPFDRAARGQVDHLRDGTHRRSRGAAHPGAAGLDVGRGTQLHQPRDPDVQGGWSAGDAPRIVGGARPRRAQGAGVPVQRVRSPAISTPSCAASIRMMKFARSSEARSRDGADRRGLRLFSAHARQLTP